MDDYADIFQRAVATIIDQILISIVIGILFVAGVVSTGASIGAIFTVVGISYVLWIIYYTYFEGTSGQTIGKRVMNIRTISADGGQLSMAQAFVRNILRIVDYLPTLYILGIILFFVTSEHQRIGDMVAGTVVVRE
jgi:uncharacterized RDD family membrane protein YckC